MRSCTEVIRMTSISWWLCPSRSKYLHQTELSCMHIAWREGCQQGADAGRPSLTSGCSKGGKP